MRDQSMPQHEIHYNIDDLMIGKKFPDVHQLMDILAGEGPNHRRLFHNDETVAEVFQATQSFEAAWSAYYHLVADRIVRDGAPTEELPDNVRKESILAEMLNLMVTGKVPIVVFPDSILTKLVGAVVNGSAILIDPENMQPLKKTYYINR
jgi:hypothetical protein